jgi:hypothetical protein
MAIATFVKAARKDYPDHGIKKGEPYYWWKFRFGPKHFSKTKPRRSQLTQSDFYSTVWDVEDRLSEFAGSIEDARMERDSAVDELRQLAEECQDKRSNMPDSLQDSETGQLLEERADELESMASELESVDLDIEQDEGETDEDYQKRVEDAIEEVKNVSYSGS